MVAMSMYHICLICTEIGSLVRGVLLHQGVDEACVILFPEATYISQNRLFALLTAKVLCMYGRCWKMSFLGQARWANVVIGYCC